jgi:hypothetical protein
MGNLFYSIAMSMVFRNTVVFLIIFFFFHKTAEGQKFYRINGDFSIKAKSVTGQSQLTVGKFYYDRNIQKLVYDNTFPYKETWVSADTNIYKIVNDKVIAQFKSPPIAMFSIFHLAITSQINNYGLKGSEFTIEKVEKQGDMVITTWLPPKYLTPIFGKVLISNKFNKLFGIVFMNSKGEVIRKQFFNKYQNISGMEFPLEVVDITYTDKKENYQVTTYKNVRIDEITQDRYFDYPIPAH